MDLQLLSRLEQAALQGIPACVDDAERLWLSIAESDDTTALSDAAGRVAAARNGRHINTCSIINARSGRCSEDCKWCSQSHCHHTGCAEYLFCDESELERLFASAAARGVERFALVTSGRKVSRKDLERFGAMYRRMHEKYPEVKLCASMGLLGREEMEMLRDVGVSRYHCNLETAASYFPRLCTTHTTEDKLRTIGHAVDAGLEVCVGGIIGMGETMRQRLELADEARRAGAVSLPFNLLNPIPGTPLGGQPLLPEREVVISAALMRLVAPDVCIRFCGGRARLSREATERMLRGGVSGAMVGDMLTTPGNSPDEDMAMFASVEDSDA